MSGVAWIQESPNIRALAAAMCSFCACNPGSTTNVASMYVPSRPVHGSHARRIAYEAFSEVCKRESRGAPAMSSTLKYAEAEAMLLRGWWPR